MKHFFLFLLCAVTICCAQKKNDFESINNKKSNKLTRIKGSRLFILAPKDYEYTKNLSRLQKSEKLYLQVIEAKTSFLAFKDKLTKESIEQQGAKVDVRKEITVNSYQGIYFEGPSKFPGETKIAIFFGDEDFYVMVVGVCETADEAGKEELKSMMQTIYYDKSFQLDPLELANFDFDQTITGFKYASTVSNFFIYNKTGSTTDQTDIEAGIQVGAFPAMSPEQAKGFMEDILGRMQETKLESTTLESTTINNYPAWKLETAISSHGKEGFLYFAMIMGKSSNVLFTATTTEDIEKYKNLYRHTAETLEIKEE